MRVYDLRIINNDVMHIIQHHRDVLQFNEKDYNVFVNFSRNEGIKNTTKLSFNEKLIVKFNSEYEYKLIAFIVHIGDNVNGGHYIAYRNIKDTYFVCDDLFIKQIQHKEFLRNVQYAGLCHFVKFGRSAVQTSL
jgi:ubiquitin C-terminal hydrolase